MFKTRCLKTDHPPLKIIGNHIGLGNVDGHLVNIACEYRVRPDPRCRHAEHSRTATDICHVLTNDPFTRQSIQGLEAPERGPVVACAECHCRFDQEWLAALRDLVRVMAAINKEPPSFDRRKLAFHLGHPVDIGQFRHRERLCAKRDSQQRQPGFVWGFGEIRTDFPQARAIFHLENADTGRFRVQVFHRIAKALRVVFSGQSGEGSESGHGQAPIRLRAA